MGTGKVLPNPSCGFDEVCSISIMFRHTCCYSQHIGVENDIKRIHTDLLCQYPVGTLCYLYASLIARGLSLFVETHHNNSSTIALYVLGMTDKHFFTFLQ